MTIPNGYTREWVQRTLSMLQDLSNKQVLNDDYQAGLDYIIDYVIDTMK